MDFVAVSERKFFRDHLSNAAYFIEQDVTHNRHFSGQRPKFPPHGQDAQWLKENAPQQCGLSFSEVPTVKFGTYLTYKNVFFSIFFNYLKVDALAVIKVQQQSQVLQTFLMDLSVFT